MSLKKQEKAKNNEAVYSGLCYCTETKYRLLLLRMAIRMQMVCIEQFSHNVSNSRTLLWSHRQNVPCMTFLWKIYLSSSYISRAECFGMSKGHQVAFMRCLGWKTVKFLWQCPFKLVLIFHIAEGELHKSILCSSCRRGNTEAQQFQSIWFNWLWRDHCLGWGDELIFLHCKE